MFTPFWVETGLSTGTAAETSLSTMFQTSGENLNQTGIEVSGSYSQTATDTDSSSDFDNATTTITAVSGRFMVERLTPGRWLRRVNARSPASPLRDASDSPSNSG